MKKLLNFNTVVIFFFIFYFITGSLIYSDYSVTPDEELHRVNGFITLKYILDTFSINLSNIYDFTNIPSLYNDWRKTYGSIFDLPFAVYEILFEVELNDIYLIRHYTVFIIFFISCIYFYTFLKLAFKNNKLAFLGVIILISTPRIFSHSFYNAKDILFLSLMILSSYYSVNLLKNNKTKYFFLSAIFCALATNIRIIGIYLPILIFLFNFFLEKNMNLKKISIFFFKYFTIYFLALYLIWPFLWANPFENFFLILKESASYPNWWNFKILYLGIYLNPENLPWHYFPVWFLSTTPVIFILIIFLGLIIFLKKYLAFFLSIDFRKNIFLWKDQKQMINFFIFLIFFIPIFFVICLNSTLYNGWRHLFFIYPFLIYFSIYGLIFIKKKINIKFYKLLIFLIIIQVLSNINFIIKSHPVQNIYFNFVSKPFILKKLPIDYWGLGNKKTIDFLLTKKDKFSISNSSFTPLHYLNYSKLTNSAYSDVVIFLGTEQRNKLSSDFIFTNYYYNENPSNIEKFKVPKNYKSYYKLIIDGILVNEIFVK
jgi:hypothetical protein|tara:strand:+ start:810 stop:2432 length:1623 start_codon:yes stop_codon:yes gene_type:complete